MTVIAALHQAGETWIGADSRITVGGSTVFPGAAAKWAVGNGCAIGVTGPGALSVLMQEQAGAILADPVPQRVRDAFRRVVVDDGLLSGKADNDQGPKHFGFSAIIATAHGVWTLGGELDLWRVSDGELWARGSGYEIALGADYVSRTLTTISAPDRVRLAVEAACRYDNGCGGAVMIQRVDHQAAVRAAAQ